MDTDHFTSESFNAVQKSLISESPLAKIIDEICDELPKDVIYETYVLDASEKIRKYSNQTRGLS
jgi:hypothetical protein